MSYQNEYLMVKLAKQRQEALLSEARKSGQRKDSTTSVYARFLLGFAGALIVSGSKLQAHFDAPSNGRIALGQPALGGQSSTDTC